MANRADRVACQLVESGVEPFFSEPFQATCEIAVGCVGLIKAVDRFEPERGLEFSTYATHTVVGELKRHFRDKGWAIRVPRRMNVPATSPRRSSRIEVSEA